MASELTINEVAHIANVAPRNVEKAIETGVLRPVKRRAMLSGTPSRHLPIHAVCYLATIGRLRFLSDIPVKRKKDLMKAIRDMCEMELEPVELEPGLRLDLPKVAGPARDMAALYVENRKKHITSDPEIFGGVPIIKGTRIPVYAVQGRLEDGDTLEDLMADYPDIPREGFIAADIYARTHPERGRPVSGGRPWETAA